MCTFVSQTCKDITINVYRPGIDLQLRAKKQNKMQDLNDDEEILSQFKADIIYVDEI